MNERRSPEEQVEMVQEMITAGDTAGIFGIIATEAMSANYGMEALVEGQQEIIRLLQTMSEQMWQNKYQS